jgi:hypothetical protein
VVFKGSATWEVVGMWVVFMGSIGVGCGRENAICKMTSNGLAAPPTPSGVTHKGFMVFANHWRQIILKVMRMEY